MAGKKKQCAMVVHEEGMAAPTLVPPPAPPPTSAAALFVVLKQVHPGESVQDKASLLAISEANNMVKSTISSGATGINSTSSTSPSDTSTHPENLPADTRCKGITVTLDNNSMWNEFSRCQTEMILTKQGRRMFPCCRFRLSGMEPFQSYLLAMDIVPVNNFRYKWSGKGWEPNGKGDPHVSRLFVHPESPATGLHWMQCPVSFYRLKLCNNTLDQEGHIILHSMHRYLPRLHIIPADKSTGDIHIDRPEVITLSFSQTEFFAVTSYQNLRITQLKIDYNPFAKGFREDAVNARSTKAKNGIFTEETENELKLSKETTTLNNLRSLFMKRSAAAKVVKDQNVPSPTNDERKVVNGDALVVERDNSTKKRPLPGAFSDFLKGAHVKVKRLTLENIQKNLNLQTDTSCSSGKQEVLKVSSKPENVLQVGETVMDDNHQCNNTDTCSKVESIQVDENKMIIDEHKNDKITMVSSDQKVRETDENRMENLPSLDSETKPEAKTNKTLPHKRPEPVPLPLLAQFLKQRQSKTRSITPKPEAPLNSKPHSTPESSTDLISYTPSANTHIESQQLVTSLSQTVTSSSSTAGANMSSTSTTSLSTTIIADPFIQVETQKPLQIPSSPSVSDPFPLPNTTSPVKLDDDREMDSISSIFGSADGDSMQGLDNIVCLDISSVFPCDDMPDTHSPTIPDDNTDAITPGTPTVTTYNFGFDVSPSKNSEVITGVIPNQELTPEPQVVANKSVSDVLFESSNGLSPELLPQDVPPDTLSTHDESLSLPLDEPSSPAFSLPSPAPSSPDPFPPDLFGDRVVPPRKTLDSFPERLLDCTGIPSSDLFTLGLYGDIPELTRNPLEAGLLNEQVVLTDLSPRESVNLFPERPCSDKPDSVHDIQSAVEPNCEPSETTVSEHIVSEITKQSSHGNTKKSKKNQKKIGKLKHIEDDEVFERPAPAPMQPSLEDVEGQLFVSFMSKTALEIHLGDDAKKEVVQKTFENSEGGNSGTLEEKIKMLEKELLNDLQLMKYRQVIHPVLQEVGLKLNLLDVTLEIDLKYLGVQLPIPPPVLLPKTSSTSSQDQFISRTGKTTDFTKIKGWRDKFVVSKPQNEGESSVDPVQNNLSAFCSDMLDEYLASEGKLIDERAANLSQTDTTPVAYQLPTKSTSYVRTLDSVLKNKKQVPTSLSSTSINQPSTYKKVKTKSKVTKKPKNGIKSNTGKQNLSITKPVNSGEKFPVSLKKPQQSKKCKVKKESNSLNAKKLTEETPAAVAFDKTPRVEVSGSPAVSCTNGRSLGLPKTLVKLMDVEDGAVWEGKRRTYITEERAAIALTALVTVEGVSKGNPDALRIIKRRAPPCLNVFCRLGCVCASLLHMRRHHHCGKPECMLGCSCLRRKVVALKNPKEEEMTTKEPIQPGQSEENKAKWKKNKMRKTYILTDPMAAPEPAKRVNKLWDRKGEDFDSEIVFSPPPQRNPSPLLLTKELQEDLESSFSPQKKNMITGRNLNFEEDNDMESSQTCSRVRPFLWKCQNKQKPLVDQHQISQAPTQDIEEGELVPANLSGPVKRLEIVSECRWSSINSRNLVMKRVCEYMAQDRLKKPFWLDNYYIQPVSKTIQGTEEEPVHIYKVNISQPTEKDKDNETVSQSEEESRQPVKKNEVKGLPFLSRCSPAGFLKAEMKTPYAPGQIMVNGKVYPQAKLELGKMGALHPANRLAAYITGRLCPVSQSGSSVVPTAPTKNTSTTASITSVAAVTSVTSTTPSTTTLLKTAVTNPPVGPVFTQFVVNHINSQNLSSTSTPNLQHSPPKIVIPSSLLMAGVPSVALSPLKAGLATQVSETSDSTGSNNFPTVSKVQAPPKITIINKSPSVPLGGSSITPTVVSPSGSSPTSGKKVVITVVSRNIAPTSSGSQMAKSVPQVPPSQTPGQKMVLQVVKTADGNTLYRNANGQLVQLVPLSQLKSMNSSILSKGPTTLFHLPTPQAVSPNKPQSVTTTTVTSSSPTSLTQPKTIITVQAPTSLGGKTVTFTAPKSVSFSSLPSTIKVAPSFLGQTGTCTLRILAPNAVIDPGNATPTSSSILSQGGFTLLKPMSSTPQNQESPKTVVSATSDLTNSPASQVQGLVDLSKPPEMVSTVNTCDITKMAEQTAENALALPSSAATSPKPTQCSGNGSSSLHSEPGQQEHSGSAANPSLKETDLDAGKEEGGISSDESELTDDSDLYSEDDEDDTDSDSYVEDVDADVDSEVKDHAEVEVDIENFEESTEKINIELLRRSARKNNPLQSNPEDVIERNKIRVHQERARRCSLRECFHNLNLQLKYPSVPRSKMSILTMSREEIESLIRQEGLLMKKKHKLEKKRDRYLQMLSMLSDKSVQSISEKVKEISAKQKALEAQNQEGEMKSKLKHRRPKPSTKPNNFPKFINTSRKVQNVAPAIDVNNVLNPTHSPSKPMDLSLKKQRSFETSDGVIEVDSTSKPKELDGSKNPSTIPVKEKSSTSNPIQRVANSITSVPVPIPIKHPSILREKTRPNILSRSQITPVSPVKDPLVSNVSIPQVIPLVNTMVPCNQILTLSKPLQPVGIASLGPQQSTTPGVASVCISVPAMPQPLGVKNPLPMLQPQFINISNSPVKVNTHVESINLPNIAKVISLVPPVNSLVVPQQVVLKQIDTTSAVQAQPTSEHQQKPHPLSEEREAGEIQPKDLTKQPAGGDVVTTSNQHGSDRKNQEDSDDPEDENLMSLLDELVLLSQQLSNDSPEPTNEDPGEESLQSEHQEDTDRDDDRALSPLFLTLDEDLMSPDSSKDEIDDIPPKVDDLVKVIFGSDSPVSSESGVTNVHSPQPPTSIASDGLIPPPLLHMKAASGGVSVHPTSEEVTWRPMPKLVPLGLKTQDAVVNKVTGSD
ncbi:MAX dimerization protein MGA a isoform X2 [Paramisgurnus dabryanus]|uniref:MAX dimerization protein MGA a isoform X2 n=1 Tax=Paramisgurnus dabryanus TaxID=90735 RepID=UPI0031F40090